MFLRLFSLWMGDLIFFKKRPEFYFKCDVYTPTVMSTLKLRQCAAAAQCLGSARNWRILKTIPLWPGGRKLKGSNNGNWRTVI